MKKTFITLLTIIAIVFICVGCSQKNVEKVEEEKPKDGNVTIQYFNYVTEGGGIFLDYESLGIDRFEVNGINYRSLPFTLYNLPGNQYYSYTIKAFDAEGTLMASCSGQFAVVEDFTITQTATLVVKHQHKFRDEWSSDETYHWYGTSCGHSPTKDKTQHSFEGDVCTVCGYNRHVHTYSSSWSSHDYGHWHNATCDHEYLRADYEEHSFGPDTIGTEPTCTTNGEGNHTCTVCGTTVSYSIAAKGHSSSGDDTIITEASCLDGAGTFTCVNCGETISFIIPATGVHSFNEDQVCSVCSLHEPTGCYVFYDKGTYSDGWRYLEAAPADLRVVNGVPTVDASVNGYLGADLGYRYGYYRTSYNGSDLYVNGTTSYDTSNCTGTDIGTGKKNTQLLVSAMGEETYLFSSSSANKSKTANYPARLCDTLTYTVNGVTYDDWFLPSKDELNLIFSNTKLLENGLAAFTSSSMYWWSSSEGGVTSAWGQQYEDHGHGKQVNYSRQSGLLVRPIRAF